MTIITTPLPNTLANGTLADANQVMANFDEVVTDVNTNAAHNGTNNDITELQGLTTPITPAQGGSNVYVGQGAGTGNAQTVPAVTPIDFTLTVGYTVKWLPIAGNTTAFTLSVGSTAAKAVLRQTATGLLPCIGGETATNEWAEAVYDGTQWQLTGGVSPTTNAKFVQNYLTGLTASVAGGTGTFGMGAGEAADTTNATLMLLASAYTKTTASWVVGSGNGGLDAGAIANNTWYHVFLIERPDTGVVDVLFSLSPNAPTLPTNYTLFRRIFSLITDSSAHWVAISQLEDEFLFLSGNLDINVLNPGTAPTLRTMSVPTGVQVWVIFNAAAVDTSGAAGQYLFTSPDENDQAPSGSIFTFRGFGASLSGGSGELIIRTNTSGQIRTRCDHSNGTTTLLGFTRGWIDRRGK